MKFHVSFIVWNKTGCLEDLKAEYLWNADETHFMSIFSTGRTLGLSSNDEVRYAYLTFCRLI